VHGSKSKDDENPIGEENHFFTADGLPIYITEDEEYSKSPTVQKDENFILANEIVWRKNHMNIRGDIRGDI